MLRCAAHRIPHPPIITLDFLLPRFATARSFERGPLICTQRTYGTTSRYVPSLSQAILAASPISQPLPQVDDPWLSDELIGSLNPKQCDLYNEQTMVLQKALRANNVPLARQSWTSLAKAQLLPFLGPPHYRTCSQLIVDIVTDVGEASVVPQDRAFLEEIMLFLAVGGAEQALQMYMHARLRRGDQETVICLYSRYIDLLKERGARDLEGDYISGVDGGSSQDVELDAEQADEVENDGEERRPVGFNAIRTVHADILLCVIAAYSMKGAFSDALHAALRARNTRLTAYMAKKTMRGLRLPSGPITTRVNQHMLLVVTAKLLSSPAGFANRLKTFADKKMDTVLQKTYDDIIAVLDSPRPWIALKPADVSQQKSVLLPDFAWASFLTAFMQRERLDLGEKIWDDLARFGITATPDVWVALLEGYAGLKMYESARSAWSMMRQQGIERTPLEWRAIIVAEFRSENIQHALKRFDEFKAEIRRRPHAQDTSTLLLVYNTVLLWLLHNSKDEEAFALVRSMREKGPQPDAVSFNTLMRFYAKTGNLTALATAIKEMNESKVVGDVYTYSIVLTALVPVRKDAIQIVLNLMKQHGVEPNVAMYTSIIQHLMEQETEASLRAALDLLDRMENNDSVNVRPNEITYTAVLTSIHRKNWLDPAVIQETTQLIWDKMIEQSLPSTTATYNVLLKACLENPAPEGVANALRYYREACDRRMPISKDTWYILLTGLLRKKEWELAIEIVNEIPEKDALSSRALRLTVDKVRQAYRQHRRLKDGWMS